MGLSTLWTALATFPMMAAVQFIAAKMGQVTGMGLGGVIRRYYSPAILYPAVLGLVIANTINAGADIGAIAAAVNLMVPIPTAVMIVPVAVVIVLLQIFGSYRLIVTVFKWTSLTLLAYIGAALLARPEWPHVLAATVIPTIRFEPRFLTTLVAILGTNISPYLFFWQTSQEVEEKQLGGRRRWLRRGTTPTELKYAAWDITAGMLFSNVVIYFVNLAAATTLFKAGKPDIQSAVDAAQALRPLAGDAATTLFAIGLLGSGCLAVPVLTASSAYALSETFGWRASIAEKPHRAVQFYMVIAFSTFAGILINFVGLNAIAALFWSAVINGFLAPPLLVLVMLMSNDRRVVGEHRNGLWLNALGWTTTAVMFAAVIGLILTWGRS
jgi:Mn2+/Fe2+ NRAMP family transporter